MISRLIAAFPSISCSRNIFVICSAWASFSPFYLVKVSLRIKVGFYLTIRLLALNFHEVIADSEKKPRAESTITSIWQRNCEIDRERVPSSRLASHRCLTWFFGLVTQFTSLTRGIVKIAWIVYIGALSSAFAFAWRLHDFIYLRCNNLGFFLHKTEWLVQLSRHQNKALKGGGIVLQKKLENPRKRPNAG